ncbi:CT620/CT621 family type III secretion system effector, partial [Chlamydiota bacterium]
SFFHELNQFKTQSGQPLSQVLADALIQSKLAAFMKANPQATSSQITAFLKGFLQQSNLQSSTLPFLQSMGDAIEDVLSKKGFPAVAGYGGEAFATEEGGKLSPNEEILSAILASYSPSGASTAALEKSAGAFTSTANDEINANQQKVEGFTHTLNQLKETQDNFGKAAAWAIGQSYAAGEPPARAAVSKPAEGRAAAAAVAAKGPAAAAAAPAAAAGSSGSLPSQFEHAILGHYMPGQQAYLEQLAMLLSLDNMGAGFGNTLMNIMSHFDAAGTNYAFSNSLHSQGTGFSGSYSKAKQQLSNERTQCSNDIASAEGALAHIKSELAQINQKLAGPPPATPSQAKILNGMKTSLEGIQANLNTAITQLSTLQALLSQISVQPPTPPQTPSKNFNVSGPDGWQSALGNDENQVINGNPQGKPPGGLVNISTDVKTFQQTYSDQSQNQQMILQMRMTEIQQEWTVVSTALQLLNQMYMTVAQAIYK